MYKSYISWDSWRSVGISEWYEIKYIKECCNGTVLKPLTLYKGNFIKYKGKSWKSVFWIFKWLNIFISCLMALVCIPEILMDFLTPILPYIAITNVVCQMSHLCQKCQKCQKCHNWRIRHATFLMDIYGNMGVKRSVRASGMQIKAIKRLWNMFYKSKFQNTDFQNFPLYFLKFPLYNVRGLRGHFPLEFRAHLYVFGISGGRRMGKHTELNLIPTFNFFYFSSLVHDFLHNCSGLVNDWFMTFYLLMICSQRVHKLFILFLWPIHVLFTTYSNLSWLVHNSW